jgi:hypothetical protein
MTSEAPLGVSASVPLLRSGTLEAALLSLGGLPLEAALLLLYLRSGTLEATLLLLYLRRRAREVPLLHLRSRSRLRGRTIETAA